VKITLASDDPPYWGASVGGEYAVAQREFGFTDAELLDVTRTAIEAAFAEDALKTSLSRKVSRSAL
jgi:adenosine deaminase